MKFSRKLLVRSVAASFLAASITAPVAQAEVAGSVGVASTYLWRGLDLGSGTPAVFGDLNYSRAGFYTGVWGSSGDTESGSEYDLYAGYGGTLGELFSYDISVWNYVYPTGDAEIDFGDLTEVVVSLGLGPVALTYYDNVAGNTGYEYWTLAGTFGDFGATIGYHDNFGATEDADGDPLHINVDYYYNENLTFTLSQFVEDEPAGDDLKFVVSYTMPLGL